MQTPNASGIKVALGVIATVFGCVALLALSAGDVYAAVGAAAAASLFAYWTWR